ncbi:MAG: HAMP domain-containing protein [Dolichospermum sp. LBC05a]|nr:HAMP domain-containing protein [Dolichospermum sp. OL01]MCO5798723.1 HAMP domain-containing protein [Dolichospermum sp. OL03]MCS6282365.1 HAMP domain-containing protein [Dolichospermum sp.]QSV60142.1 MAG: HAMP domain-containing protein [Dolichospermum sp. LBC05a]
MEARIDNQELTYDRARIAYEQQDYELAAVLIDKLVQNSPTDPNLHLLKGHTYYMLQQYDVAKDSYQSVLYLTSEEEVIRLVNNCLATIDQYTEPFSDYKSPFHGLVTTGESLDLGMMGNLHSRSVEMNSFAEYEPPLDPREHNPFASHPDSMEFDSNALDGVMSDDPFGVPTEYLTSDPISGQLELPPFWQEDISGGDNQAVINHNLANETSAISDDSSSYSPFAATKLSLDYDSENQTEILMGEDIDDLMDDNFEDLTPSENDTYLEINEQAINNNQDQPISASFTNNSAPPQRQFNFNSSSAKNNFDDDSFDLDAFESAFGAENEGDLGAETFISTKDTSNISSGGSNKNNIEFLNDFDEFDDLGDIAGFDLTEDSSFGDGGMLSESPDSRGNSLNQFVDDSFNDQESDAYQDRSHRDQELFTITGAQEAVPVFTQSEVAKTEPNVAFDQGLFGPFENASLEKKQWWIAGTVGLVSLVGVAIVSAVTISISPAQQRESVRNTGWLMALAAGATGAATAGFMSNLTLKQIRRTTKDLQSQFDSVRQGNMNVEATVYSQDELGYLATGFNDMARVIFTTTNEAQRKAMEMEEAKENLQRQVIRLLDDVEGAARGDLTVQAEVTADVLGAVADAFNLTIQNLRDIVQQVKVAARDVTKGSTNSETFARALSGDALRQAEELAVTLNSVQVMTDSIQRVAEAAKEAETVAREASKIAQKGGEAVENTVVGILEIRETVAETSRKVKRLAESSQEINSIVAIVSQIASRTNLLALNASIEAARAGEAGRGFAIVADEVRQLADRSAKSLKEIEQIVMQIQSETSSVMTAMEEGTQQVIHQTKLAEEAKRSLDNIIQVADHIDILVRSITSDTVEQTETSRAVAQVMQSVELTAQETSQEAQRVSGALQHLVGVSRDLIASVERFRVETTESR